MHIHTDIYIYICEIAPSCASCTLDSGSILDAAASAAELVLEAEEKGTACVGAPGGAELPRCHIYIFMQYDIRSIEFHALYLSIWIQQTLGPAPGSPRRVPKRTDAR